MPKFRKKPVIIEAMQWDGSLRSIQEICAWANTDDYEDPWIDYLSVDYISAFDVQVHTLEGSMTVIPNDWIIKGVQGEFYPCKPDIFEQTYESVNDVSA